MSEQARIPLSNADDDASCDWSAAVLDASQGRTARLAFRAYLTRSAAAGSDFEAAELIFGELLANVIRHANGMGEFRLYWRDAGAQLIAEDRGCGFRDDAPRGTLDDPAAESGRGLILVALLAADVTLGNRPSGGACVRVVLPVTRGNQNGV